ncbi:methyltransferase domain-containing protein [Candidatus Pacearchaeota archaeon]|nr:methyltransferase domain-containing protein [Candidatus Pacearchaeota archaeon]
MVQKQDIITGRASWLQQSINVIPKSWRLRLNPRRYAIETFVRQSALKIKPSSLLLDAGAGPCPYKPFFAHCTYRATDFTDPHHLMDFTCDLQSIPQKTNTYDAILSTEVLEHVSDPLAVLKEKRRILKKGGVLYLTTPQSWMMHQKPHNYFYFTYFGLKHLLKEAGFTHFVIKPRGGYFWNLADTLRFNSLRQQYRNNTFLYCILTILEYPLTNILFPFMLFHLDWIDQQRDWTMGWTVTAIK